MAQGLKQMNKAALYWLEKTSKREYIEYSRELEAEKLAFERRGRKVR